MMQLLLVLVVIAAVLGFCTLREDPASPPASEGRPETRRLEAVPGYDGKAVREKLDEAIQTHEQRPQQLDRMMEQQMSGAPPPEQ